MDMSGFVFTCSAGDTFDSIALTVYGDEKYAAELLCANPEHAMTCVFAGQERLLLPSIVIPPEDQMELPAAPPWKES